MSKNREDRTPHGTATQEPEELPAISSDESEGGPRQPAGGDEYPEEIPFRASFPRLPAGALRNIGAFILVGAVIAGLVWYFNRPGEGDDFVSVDPRVAASGREPTVGEKAPDFRVQELDGEYFQLSDFLGRPVWITFWASWCAACRAETKDIQEMHEKYGDDGLVIIALNLGESDDLARGYVEATSTTYLVGLDRDEAIAGRYYVRGLPMHYFIGADGILHELRFGSLSAKAMEEAVMEIRPSGTKASGS